MSNHNGGAVFKGSLELLLDKVVRLQIDIGSSFIKNKDLRFSNDGSSKAQ
jgi:hypothetical protein